MITGSFAVSSNGLWFEPFGFAPLKPTLGSFSDRDAGAVRRMRAGGDLRPRTDQPIISFLAGLEGLQSTRAALVRVVGNSCGLALAARFPRTLPNRSHCQVFPISDAERHVVANIFLSRSQRQGHAVAGGVALG
jgi:hypothetical protein